TFDLRTSQTKSIWFDKSHQVEAGLVYPFFGILLSPIIAALAMTFSSVSLITNALRLKKIKS
ncbi:MAG: hypothetical protein O3C19_07555, partial [Bacteroidetes bacterium]|nr:hypothetical protein [Bacteroidota bacterium]